MKASHGGDLRTVAERSGRRTSELLDFSANVNPLGPPDGVRALLRQAADDTEPIVNYPDPAYRALRAACAMHTGVEATRIAVANGGAALLDALVNAERPRVCVLPVPAFSEYHKALARTRTTIVPVALRADHEYLPDIDALVRAATVSRADWCLLANPNNPTGALAPAHTLHELRERLAQLDCRLVVDEAFIDYVPAQSIVGDLCATDRTVVLRSVTKFYAMPGIRVGYAVADAATVAAIDAVLPSWPIGEIAARCAVAALADLTYADRSREKNVAVRRELCGALRSLGVTVWEGAANYVFADIASLAPGPAQATAARLARQTGIVVRACDDYHSLETTATIRVAVRARDENQRLVEALATLRA